MISRRVSIINTCNEMIDVVVSSLVTVTLWRCQLDSQLWRSTVTSESQD
jgi:hypothetical protein